MARYPEMNGTLVRSDLMYTMVYANQVTNGWFGLIVVLSFFLVTFLGGMMAQFRFTTRIEPEKILLASSFATLGFATILQSTSGILSPVYFFVIVGVTILSALWNLLGN